MIAKFQYITGGLPYDQILYSVRDFCRAGGQWVQLRVKEVSPGKYLEIAQRTKRICNQYNTKLIINDDPHIARAVNAHGVHLGKKDMRPRDARILLFPHQIVGSTCNTIRDLTEVVEEAQSDYIGLGPIFRTNTKNVTDPILGIKKLKDLMDEVKLRKIKIPIIAVGGIDFKKVDEVYQCGVRGIAFSSMFENATDKKKLIKEIIQITENEQDCANIEYSR